MIECPDLFQQVAHLDREAARLQGREPNTLIQQIAADECEVNKAMEAAFLDYGMGMLDFLDREIGRQAQEWLDEEVRRNFHYEPT